MAWYSGMFGGGGGDSSGGSSSGFWNAIISGAVSYAGAKSNEKKEDKAIQSAENMANNKSERDLELAREVAGIQGFENRKTSQFENDLKEYNAANDRRRKRIALDTYGSFSTVKNWAPASFAPPAIPTAGVMPVNTQGNYNGVP